MQQIEKGDRESLEYVIEFAKGLQPDNLARYVLPGVAKRRLGDEQAALELYGTAERMSRGELHQDIQELINTITDPYENSPQLAAAG
jgi:hypothetical protein